MSGLSAGFQDAEFCTGVDGDAPTKALPKLGKPSSSMIFVKAAHARDADAVNKSNRYYCATISSLFAVAAEVGDPRRRSWPAGSRVSLCGRKRAYLYNSGQRKAQSNGRD